MRLTNRELVEFVGVMGDVAKMAGRIQQLENENKFLRGLVSDAINKPGQDINLLIEAGANGQQNDS